MAKFYLIRTPVAGQKNEFQDLDFEAAQISIGSDNQHAIQLPGLGAGSLTINAKNKTTANFICSHDLVVNSPPKSAQKGQLKKGLIYQLGSYDLSVIDAPSGFDFALQIRQSERVTQQQSYQLIKRPNAPIRLLSYLAFVSILVVFLLLPYWRTQQPALDQSLAAWPLPTDHAWLSGPLAMAHRVPEIGDNCSVCHQQAFVQVADAQCLDCHKSIGSHHGQADDSDLSSIFAVHSCQDCHKEHNEPARITRHDDALCVGCHANIETLSESTTSKVSNVDGFTAAHHPEFRLSLLQAKGDGAAFGWEKNRPLYDSSVVLQEQSNLKFSHQVHLDGEQVVNSVDSTALNCDSCHQLQPDGRQFAPITMDKDCRSCHQLTYDVFNPDLELPHGDLRAAAVALQAHYIREFTDPDLRAKRAKQKPRRIPGKNMSEATCEGSGLDCGRAEAFKEAEFQFNKSGCVTCHVVKDNGGDTLLSKWFVYPIRINNDWFIKSQFDHQSHLSVSGKDQQEICLSCHAVDDSDVAQDINMPNQSNCLGCHQQGISHSVELPCVSCHVYHY